MSNNLNIQEYFDSEKQKKYTNESIVKGIIHHIEISNTGSMDLDYLLNGGTGIGTAAVSGITIWGSGINVQSRKNEKIKYIVLHYTASTTSIPGTAKQVAKYFEKTQNEKVKRSSDFIVDDTQILQYTTNIDNFASLAIPHGNGIMCRNSINIEMCSSMKPGYDPNIPNHAGWYFTPKVLANTLALVRSLCKKYNIPKSNIKRHWDVNHKKCPGIIGWNPASGNESLYTSFIANV